MLIGSVTAIILLVLFLRLLIVLMILDPLNLSAIQGQFLIMSFNNLQNINLFQLRQL